MKLKIRKANITNQKYLLIFIVLFVYILIKAYSMGDDINVYLYASEQLSRGEDIYSNNIYNEYRYSPLFAWLIRPLSLLPYEWGRVIWAVINTLAALRIWSILKEIISKELELDQSSLNLWSWGVLLLSIGFFNNNLILGQITVLILWLSVEGVYLVLIKGKDFAGSILIALGINIKIMPILCLYYLFLKFKWSAVLISTLLVLISLFLPALFIGKDYNNKLLDNWMDQINPSEVRYIFEDNNGCHSLSALLPGYFYNFESVEDNSLYNLKRKIVLFSYDTLFIILQLSRFLLLLSFLWLVFYTSKQRSNFSLHFFWEVSYLLIASYLIFPHQLKYAMLYFIPGGAYMILYILLLSRTKDIILELRVIAILAFIFMSALAIMGRDIVGDVIINILDYYHVMGLICVIFLGFLIKIKPSTLMLVQAREQNNIKPNRSY